VCYPQCHSFYFCLFCLLPTCSVMLSWTLCSCPFRQCTMPASLTLSMPASLTHTYSLTQNAQKQTPPKHRYITTNTLTHSTAHIHTQTHTRTGVFIRFLPTPWQYASTLSISSDVFLYFEDLREGRRAHTYTCTDIHMTAACHFCVYKPVTASAVHTHTRERARVYADVC